jgi:hypothetical protein
MAVEPVGIVEGGQSDRGELLSDVYDDIKEQGREFVDDVRNAGKSFIATVRDTINDITESPEAQKLRQRMAGSAAPSTAFVNAPTQSSPVQSSGWSWWGWILAIIVIILLIWLFVHFLNKNKEE